jgi:hypothetical protein
MVPVCDVKLRGYFMQVDFINFFQWSSVHSPGWTATSHPERRDGIRFLVCILNGILHFLILLSRYNMGSRAVPGHCAFCLMNTVLLRCSPMHLHKNWNPWWLITPALLFPIKVTIEITPVESLDHTYKQLFKCLKWSFSTLCSLKEVMATVLPTVRKTYCRDAFVCPESRARSAVMSKDVQCRRVSIIPGTGAAICTAAVVARCDDRW